MSLKGDAGPNTQNGGKGGNALPSKRTDIGVPPPPVPPREPDKRKPSNKEEFPARPGEIPKLGGRPINEIIKNNPLIFEVLKEEFRKELTKPLHANRGDPFTQGWNKDIATEIVPIVLSKWGPDTNSHVEHTHGAHSSEGRYLKEAYRRNVKTKGVKGSSNADLSFEVPRKSDGNKTTLHLNTGKTLKDGKTGIANERSQMERLAQNARDEIARFLPKLRPGMDRAKIEKRTEAMLTEYFTDIFGPPSK